MYLITFGARSACASFHTNSRYDGNSLTRKDSRIEFQDTRYSRFERHGLISTDRDEIILICFTLNLVFGDTKSIILIGVLSPSYFKNHYRNEVLPLMFL